MMHQEQHITEQLSCSVCMCLFKNPVTIQCGHTFCRYCLLNYTRTKPSCPICRTSLTHVSEQPPQDQTIARIIQHMKKKQIKKQHSQNNNNIVIDHFQNLLLIDIRTNDLLLPFTKVIATFQLQSQALIGKLERFVARQQIPYNKYGIVSKISQLNQLRHNVYQCVIQGRSFCQINNQLIEKNSDQNQQYFYRTCQAKVIYEDENVNKDVLQIYLKRFNQIKDKNVLQKVYKCIDHQKLYSKQNLTAVFYSIIKIIPSENEKKYQIATSFDPIRREQFITNFLQKCKFDVSKQPYKFVSLGPDSGFKKQGFVVLIAFFIIIFLVAFNNDYSQL